MIFVTKLNYSWEYLAHFLVQVLILLQRSWAYKTDLFMVDVLKNIIKQIKNITMNFNE